MGTRSTVKFYDKYKEEQVICSIYHQYDGYIGGIGHELAKFINRKTIVNGYGLGMTNETHANGIGCLAAQYIAESKTDIGGLYMTGIDDEQEFNYQVRLIDDKINIKIYDWESKLIFDGTPDELLKVN